MCWLYRRFEAHTIFSPIHPSRSVWVPFPPQVQNQDNTQHWCWAWWRSCYGMRSANLPVSSSVVHCQVHCQELSGLCLCSRWFSTVWVAVLTASFYFFVLYENWCGSKEGRKLNFMLGNITSPLLDNWCAPAVFFGTGMMAAAHKQCGPAAYAMEIPTSFPKTTASIPEAPCWSLYSVATLRGRTDPKAHWVLAGSGAGGVVQGCTHRLPTVWGWCALLALWASL